MNDKKLYRLFKLRDFLTKRLDDLKAIYNYGEKLDIESYIRVLVHKIRRILRKHRIDEEG